MENILKCLGEDNLGLAILTTLFIVLFLILLLFKNYLKQSVLISFKKIDFLKLNFQLRSQDLFFEEKRKRLELLSSDNVVILLSFFLIILILKMETAKRERFCKREYKIIL